MFFRIKKIKGKEYAYAVENEWRKKGSRQKVKVYLGRAYIFELKNNADFFEYFRISSIEDYISKNNNNRIIKDLIELEIHKFSIDKGVFSIDLEGATIKKNNKDVVLLINDGYMCGFALKRLLDFQAVGDEHDGYLFARAFVEAGIKVPQEIFIGLFEKLNKGNLV